MTTTIDAYLDVASRATRCPRCEREALCQAELTIGAFDEDADRAAGGPRRMNGYRLTFACAACRADICVSLQRNTDGWRQIWRWRLVPVADEAPPQPLPTRAVDAIDRAWMDAEIPF